MKPTAALIFLLLALFAAAGGAAAQTAAPITISLTNYAFTPNALNLSAGVTYRLHLTNDASKAHSFRAPEFFAASQISPADQSKVEDGEVELEGGQAADITVTPSRAGAYGFDCSHFMHHILGMHGEITVR